jgi:hypothetical protein
VMVTWGSVSAATLSQDAALIGRAAQTAMANAKSEIATARLVRRLSCNGTDHLRITNVRQLPKYRGNTILQVGLASLA